jgi:hypothetical protein
VVTLKIKQELAGPGLSEMIFQGLTEEGAFRSIDEFCQHRSGDSLTFRVYEDGRLRTIIERGPGRNVRQDV